MPNGTLFGGGVCASIKEDLLKELNVHTVAVSKGVFSPYTGIRTNIFSLIDQAQRKEVWYYEHPLPEGKQELYQDPTDTI